MRKNILFLPILAFSLLGTGCSNQQSEDCKFKFYGQHCSLNNLGTYKRGSKVSLDFTVDNGYKLPDAIQVDGSNDYTYNVPEKKLDITITNNTTVVCWAEEDEGQYFTVKFEVGDGSYVQPQLIKKGGNAIEPKDPTNEGYTFGGWYDNEKCEGEKFNFIKTDITRPLTLYAKWDPIHKNMLYQLDFSDPSNIGKNTAPGSTLAGAVVKDDQNLLEVQEGAHKGKNVLSFAKAKDSVYNASYLTIEDAAARKVLNNETTTIAMWVWLPSFNASNQDAFNSGSSLLGIRWGEDNPANGFYASPFERGSKAEGGSWNGYGIHYYKDGAHNNLTQVDPSPKTYNSETPISGPIQSVEYGWHLIGFTFMDKELRIYQNGKLIQSFYGFYSLKEHNISQFFIGVSSFFGSSAFNGKIADVRVYDYVLSREAYNEEYNLQASDFLTADYEFDDINNPWHDSARGYTAAPKGTATVGSVEGKDPGSTVSAAQISGDGASEKTDKDGIQLPSSSFLGHNEITISTNVFIKNTDNRSFTRLFNVESNDSGRFMSCYVGFETDRPRMLRFEYCPKHEAQSSSESAILKDDDYSIPKNTWINVTVSCSNLGAAMYVDGQIIAYDADFNYNPSILYDYTQSTFRFTIGYTYRWGDKPIEAYYDNFKVYSLALEESDILRECCGQTDVVKDDELAVKMASANYKPYCDGIRMPVTSTIEQGVGVICESQNAQVIDEVGTVMRREYDQECEVRALFYRGDYSLVKTYKMKVPKLKDDITLVPDDLANTRFIDGGHKYTVTLKRWQNDNFDYMANILNQERLLYNYRLAAGLDTKSASSYGNWISTASGGAGQFEAQYVGAMARYINSGNTAQQIQKAKSTVAYFIDEMKKCQDNYPLGNPGFPGEEGYFSAIPHEVIYAYDDPNIGPDKTVQTTRCGSVKTWVPYYMYHKNLQMLYDVYTYATTPDMINTRETAKDMFIKAMHWLNEHVKKIPWSRREGLFDYANSEFGGIMEMAVRAYELTKDPDYLYTFHFFEEPRLFSALANNVNVFEGLHANTAIPKVIAAAVMYDVTGDNYYGRIAENGWDMIVNHMTYANGGVSREERFDRPDYVDTYKMSLETCCSHNLLRLTDFLFKFNPKPEYAHYYEKVFYNHILGSMYVQYNGDSVVNAAKCYNQDSRFGAHRVYSSAENSFWCCCCTGMDNFAKLTHGEFYNQDDKVYVNMYNAASYKYNDSTTISVGGEYLVDNNVTVTFNQDNVDTNKFRFIKPGWIQQNPVIKLNYEPIDYTLENGYMVIDKIVSSTDIITIDFGAFPYYLVSKRGDSNFSALFYGPLLIEPDLGESEESFIRDDPNPEVKKRDKGTDEIKITGVIPSRITKRIETVGDPKEKDRLRFDIDGDNIDHTFMPYMDAGSHQTSMYMRYTFI